MELRDLIVTPLVLIMVYVAAYFIRPWVTDNITRRYFFPALTVRIIGALAVGFIYQFYYSGGDTFAFHTHGSRPIWEAIMESPSNGFRILFSNGEYGPGLWKTAERIWYWRDPQSFFVIRIAAIFDLFTFSSYSGTAVLFSLVAFAGAWALFQTFYKLYPEIHKWIAISALFVPTVVFWGSGIFKDSLTLAALGFATYSSYTLFIERRFSIGQVLILALSFSVVYALKVYILLCFLPAVLLWWFASSLQQIRPFAFRIILAPFVMAVALMLAYFAITKVAEDDPRYNVYRLAETARITAYDIRYGWGARTGEGSGYSLGELDGSWQSMFRLAPRAINVSLFRPYLWEVDNPLMLLSALEGLAVLALTLFIMFKTRLRFLTYSKKPEILFCLLFSLIFAFAVGVSTYNFGTLSRYRIPLVPYFLMALSFIYSNWKRDRKFEVFASTE